MTSRKFGIAKPWAAGVQGALAFVASIFFGLLLAGAADDKATLFVVAFPIFLLVAFPIVFVIGLVWVALFAGIPAHYIGSETKEPREDYLLSSAAAQWAACVIPLVLVCWSDHCVDRSGWLVVVGNFSLISVLAIFSGIVVAWVFWRGGVGKITPR